ncbi:class I SAM-dependent methyltransferase [Roseibium sp. M-1]
MKSLTPETIEKLLSETLPSFQAISPSDNNMGFGFIYYGMVRVLRPKNICVIGSKAGFSVITLALGLKDNAGTHIKEVTCWDTKLVEENGIGKVFFVDPSFSSERNDPNHWYGIGFWDDEKATVKHWQKFGVEDFVEHFKITSAAFLRHPRCPKNIDLLFIDGDHSFEGIMHDFNQYYDVLSQDAIVLAHDVDPALKDSDPATGGYEALLKLDTKKFEVFRLPVFPGLAVVRKRNEDSINSECE